MSISILPYLSTIFILVVLKSSSKAQAFLLSPNLLLLPDSFIRVSQRTPELSMVKAIFLIFLLPEKTLPLPTQHTATRLSQINIRYRSRIQTENIGVIFDFSSSRSTDARTNLSSNPFHFLSNSPLFFKSIAACYLSSRLPWSHLGFQNPLLLSLLVTWASF